MKKIISFLIFMVSMPVLSDDSSPKNILDEKISNFRLSQADHLSFIPYRKNYITYSHSLDGVNNEPIEEAYPRADTSFRDYELQFQFSFLLPLAVDIMDSPVSFFGAYTQRSFWQIFDSEDSAPFRETNYEPEIWFSYFYDLQWGDLKSPAIWLGLNHQSNGQYVNLSRGWNRVFVKAFLSYQQYSFMLTHWQHVSEGVQEDDQYDYEKYIGNGQLAIDYSFNKNDVSFIYAYSFDGSEYGSITFDFSVPISDSLALYVRYFDGYGESLIDLEYESRTLSVGVKLNEW